MPPEKAGQWFKEMHKAADGEQGVLEKAFVPKVAKGEPFASKEAVLKNKAAGGTWVSRTAEALEEKESEAGERDRSTGEKGKE